MKNSIQGILKLTAVAFMMALFVTGCNDDDDNIVGPTLTGQSKTYTLKSESNPAISGTVKFAERSDNTTVVTIDLDGTTSGTHPAHIHANAAAETGGIIIDLNSVAGANGMSETMVSKLNSGTAIKYSELLALNGYVDVHASATDLATLIAQGDIGENELTASSTTYALSAVNDSGVNGTVTFGKRVSGSTLVTVDLQGASPTGNHPMYIYENDVTTPGPIAINLNNYLGSTGKSVTSVRKLNNNTAISYDQLTDFNGHIRIGTSATDPAFIAQGNIGSNR